MLRYTGTTADYWLDKQPLENWFMFLRYAEEEEVHKARILAGILSGQKFPPEPKLIVKAQDEAPDRDAFYRNPEIRKHIKRPT